MKIAHLNTLGSLSAKYQKMLNSIGEYVSLTKPNMSPNEAIESVKDADIVLVAPSAIKPFSKEIIDNSPKLKHIALVTVGFDWVDVGTAKEKGISISRPVGANSLPVAEHAFGMMLDLAKRITEFDKALRKNGECDFRKFTGVEITGKTLGIIGLGNVGKHLLNISKGFGMRVLAFDRSEKSCNDFEVVSLEKLLTESDFVVVSIPLSESTKGLLSSKELEGIKQGAILVNVAREEIVDQDAVINAIKTKKLRGYGVETEIMKPVPINSPYFDYPNIIVNPHNAFNTIETKQRTDKMVVDNIVSFIEGKSKNLL